MNKPLVSFKHVYCRRNGFIRSLLTVSPSVASCDYDVRPEFAEIGCVILQSAQFGLSTPGAFDYSIVEASYNQ